MRGYRVFLWSHDHPVPPHVHVGKRERVSDWRLESLECVDPDGFSAVEISEQRRLLRRYRDTILVKWKEHWRRYGEHDGQT